jgi:hypothetical protein
MTNRNNNTKRSASNSRHSLRGSNGRFVSAGSRTVVKNNLPSRDSKGRFVSASSSKSVRAKSTVVKSTPVKSTSSKSSFIKSMTISGDVVNVIMTRDLKTTYTYKPTQAGMVAIKNVIKTKGSLGSAYNSYLKGREVSRTIYR